MLPMRKGVKGQKKQSDMDQNLSPEGLVKRQASSALEDERQAIGTDIFAVKATFYHSLQSLTISSFCPQCRVQGYSPENQDNS